MTKLSIILQMSGNETLFVGIVIALVLTAVIVGPKLLKAGSLNSYCRDYEREKRQKKEID